MAQQWHTLVIATKAGIAIYTQVREMLEALRSTFSGSSTPADVVAYQVWADTAAKRLKQRNAANDGDVEIGGLLTDNAARYIRLQAGGALATATFRLPVSGEKFRVESVEISTDTTTSGSDGSNNYAVQMDNVTQATTLFATAPTTNGAEITADTRYNLAPDQNQEAAAGDVVTLTVTKTGSPTAVTNAWIDVVVTPVGS